MTIHVTMHNIPIINLCTTTRDICTFQFHYYRAFQIKFNSLYKNLHFFSAPPPNRKTNHADRPKMEKSTNWVIYFAIVVCIIIIIGFIFIIIKFFRKQMCDFFGKKPPPQERAVSFTNIEAKSTETLDTQTWFHFRALTCYRLLKTRKRWITQLSALNFINSIVKSIQFSYLKKDTK